jgi:hypothetical protein
MDSRIHRFRIRIQHFRLNTNPDPDPGFISKKVQKKIAAGRPSYRRSLQPSKANIQYFKT